MDRDQAIAIVKSSGLAAHADTIINLLAPSARAIVVDKDTASHFGGIPQLPLDMPWPHWDNRAYLKAKIAMYEEEFKNNPRAIGLRDSAKSIRSEFPLEPVPLMFLAQLDLEELSESEHFPGLPTSGILAFFGHHAAAGFDPLERGCCSVLYLAPSTTCVPTLPPDCLEKEWRFPKRFIRYVSEWTLPSFIELDGKTHLDICDEYGELCARLRTSAEPIHRFGGHPQSVQGEMSLECQLVTNGLYCGDSTGYEDPRRTELESGASEWRLLLQLDSDEQSLNWMWGDAGKLYFWIRQSDLEAKRFDQSWLIEQSY